jgi:hypothetical protein
MMMNVFWDVALCSTVEIDRHVRRIYCLHLQGEPGLFQGTLIAFAWKKNKKLTNVAAFWSVMPCNSQKLMDISEVLTASIIRAI